MSKRNMLDVFDSGEVQQVLRDSFYTSEQSTQKAPRKTKPDPDYEVICISLYKKDLARLDHLVKELKSQGHRKLSRSSLIRYALATVNVEKLPAPY